MLAGPILAASALTAVIVPALIAYNLPPSATFINQAAALIGWGAFLAALVHAIGGPAASREGTDRGLGSLLGALGLLFLCAVGTLAVGRSTGALVASSAGLILAAMLAAMVGVAVARAGQAETAFHALAVALVVAGILSVVVSLIQVYLPSFADSRFIAYPSVEGRASGNLRQPNHLCSLVLWSLVALAWMYQRRLIPRALAGAIGVAFVLTLVLSASRTGWIGVAMLFIWGCVDRRLSRSTRIGLALTLPMYWLIWFGLTAAAAATNHVFYGQTRISGMQDFSSSRIAIWANTIEMIRQHPWFGVGWGEFNFAWSLTPFVKRPSAFFDHTHNILLQFAVELGLPMALLVCALLTHALWRSLRHAMKATGAEAHMLSAAWMIVVMMVIHSQLEYPLWYAYFLLPTAFAFGLTLSSSLRSSTTVLPSGRAPASRMALGVGSVALAIIGVASLYDYYRVVIVFEPPDDAPPLDQRIAAGERSWFFAHHAYYAGATMAKPADALPALANASHYLLDTRLMTAWAEALAANGQVDKARFIAARLREFNNADSRPFFEPCEKAAAGATVPFQCSPPERTYRADDFR